MKGKAVVFVMLVVIMLTGCRKGTISDVTGDIVFERLSGGEMAGFTKDMDPLQLKARLVHEDKEKIYIAVNIPFNSDIKGIEMRKNGTVVIALGVKEGMENQDPFFVLAPSEVKMIAIDKEYKAYFNESKTMFTADDKPVGRLLDYETALSKARDYMETDFISTMNCLALYDNEETKLCYILFFGDNENVNRAGNEVITGVIGVDALNGKLLEYRVFSRKNLPGTFRLAGGFRVEGWKDSSTIVATGVDDQGYYLVDMYGEASSIGSTTAADIIQSYTGKTNSLSGYYLVQDTAENEYGFIYTKKAEVVKAGSSGRTTLKIPSNTFIVNEKWDRTGKNLYFTTEVAEPSYGNFWSYYTLWCFNIQDKSLKEVGKIPAKEFFLSPDGTKLAFNDLEGNLFLININTLMLENTILK